MKLLIGEHLRALRLQQGLTQEQLAEALGVSCQSVSRWELEVCYPDLELLPVIANYFEVTLDELVGMSDIRSEARRNALFTDALILERQGDWGAAIDVLRGALRMYPNDDGFRSELALALGRTGEAADRGEAIRLSEQVLMSSTNEKLRSTTRANLAFLYKADGQLQRAAELARSLPHIWECRELLLPELVPAAEREAAAARGLNIAYQVLRDAAAGESIPFSLGYREEELDLQAFRAALR